VRSWEELPNDDSCFSWSLLFLGFLLKKLLIFPVRLFLPGLALVGEVAFDVELEIVGASRVSFGWPGASASPFLMSRVRRRELICRHHSLLRFESRDASDFGA
jgi:hypothetical protein